MARAGWFLAAAAGGYLVGSLSSTRLLARFAAPGEDLTTTEYKIDEHGGLVSHGVSPSALGARAGGGWGALAAVLDIGKAWTVTRVIEAAWPDDVTRSSAALGGVAAVLGHAYPAYYGFVGGFGQSPIVGSALALDWVVMPVTTTAGWVIGVAVGDALVALEAWPALMVPFAVWRADPTLVAWSLAVNAVYWARMAPEARQRVEHYRTHRPPWSRRVEEIFQGYL